MARTHERLTGESNDFTDEAWWIYTHLPKMTEQKSYGWNWVHATAKEIDGKPAGVISKFELFSAERPPKVTVSAKSEHDERLLDLEFNFQPNHTVEVKQGWPVVKSGPLAHDDPRASHLQDALALLVDPRPQQPAA